MAISNGECRSDQRVGPADAAVEQGNVVGIRVVAERRPARQVIEPFYLFLNLKRIEIVGGDRRRRESPHTSQPAHRQGQLLASRRAYDNNVLGEFQTIRTDSNAVI